MRRVLACALSAFISLLGATAAQGAVVVRSARERILVTGPGVAVRVDRAPFRLRITGAGGDLSEVINGRPAPSRLAPMADPIAPGTDAQRSGQLYAPLAFLVGRQEISQHAGLVWGGNLLSGTRFGTQYAARRVIGARRIAGGVLLTVSTDDPSGRRLLVSLRIVGGRVSVDVVPRPATGVALMADAFTSSRSEAFYGFGGRHDALDQRGRAFSSFVAEENIPHLGPPGTPIGTLYPNGPAAAYYPQAQFVSSRGYGFWLRQPELAWFRLDSDTRSAWSVAVAARSLSYVVVPGRAQAAIAGLTAVTGRQPVPPAWALGPMLDRLVKNNGETRANYESELTADLANLRRYRLPITAYRIEGWGFGRPGNDGLVLPTVVSPAVQRRVIVTLRGRHIHPLAYLRPWITPGSAPDRARLTVRSARGSTSVTTGTGGQPIALLDFTNPAAVRFWRRELDRMLDLGFDGFMADFGEEVLGAMHFADGETGATMHNRYLVLYMRATRAAVTAYERAHRGRSIWFFNRAGYSGSAGAEGANFPGDESTDWGQAAGLASLAPDMLSRAIGGAFGFATDVGGYYDYTTPATSKELFLRWAEWAALSPVFRLHGSGQAGTHTPWSYDARTVAAYRALSRLHERAGALILALWKIAERTGLPPTRPLWLAFPADPRAATQEQEWMLGHDVLAAPVVTQGVSARVVYFPRGCWRDPRTGLTERGPKTARVSVPLTRLPYFFACGTDPFRHPAG